MGGGSSKKKKKKEDINTSVVPFNSNDAFVAGNKNTNTTDIDNEIIIDTESKWDIAEVDKSSGSQQRFLRYMKDVYAAYDGQGTGLRAVDLIKMMNDMSKHSINETDVITLDDARYVVAAMDKDGDNVISFDEFSNWIKTGREKPKEHMEKLKARDDQSRRLVNFLDTIVFDIEKNENKKDDVLVTTGEDNSTDDTLISTDACEPTDLPILPAKAVFDIWIKDTFCHFDSDGDEKLDPSELYQLCLHIQRWSLKKYGTIWSSKKYKGSIYEKIASTLQNFSPRDAGMIHRALDRDKDGVVDLKEFSNWLYKGSQKTMESITKLANRSENTSKMVGLLIGFEFCVLHTVGSKSELEKSLISLFQKYDQDQDGHLDTEELFKMIQGIETTISDTKKKDDSAGDPDDIIAETAALIHGQSPKMTQEDVIYIMSSMDTDGNGTLELPEWIAWLRAGLNRTEKQLNQVPTERQGVVRFIRALRKHFTINVNNNPFFASDDFESALQRLFVSYDKNNTGNLNATSLLLMMSELNTRTTTTALVIPTEADAAFVIGRMDMDGNGEVDCSEFVAWIMAGISKSNADMKRLADKSAQHARLIIFLRSVQNECIRSEDFADLENNSSSFKAKKHRTGAPMRVRVSQVFTDYDADGDGHIDTYEMLAVSSVQIYGLDL